MSRKKMIFQCIAAVFAFAEVATILVLFPQESFIPTKNNIEESNFGAVMFLNLTSLMAIGLIYICIVVLFCSAFLSVLPPIRKDTGRVRNVRLPLILIAFHSLFVLLYSIAAKSPMILAVFSVGSIVFSILSAILSHRVRTAEFSGARAEPNKLKTTLQRIASLIAIASSIGFGVVWAATQTGATTKIDGNVPFLSLALLFVSLGFFSRKYQPDTRAYRSFTEISVVSIVCLAYLAFAAARDTASVALTVAIAAALLLQLVAVFLPTRYSASGETAPKNTIKYELNYAVGLLLFLFDAPAILFWVMMPMFGLEFQFNVRIAFVILILVVSAFLFIPTYSKKTGLPKRYIPIVSAVTAILSTVLTVLFLTAGNTSIDNVLPAFVYGCAALFSLCAVFYPKTTDETRRYAAEDDDGEYYNAYEIV